MKPLENVTVGDLFGDEGASKELGPILTIQIGHSSSLIFASRVLLLLSRPMTLVVTLSVLASFAGMILDN